MSLTYAAISLGIAGAAGVASYVKKRHDAQGLKSQSWAKLPDVRKWGLLSEQRLDANGWPVPAFIYGSMGKTSDIIADWTTTETSRHALISAPTGAGKTWTVFYPTLMYGWTHSCVVHVRKKELADLTVGWRSQFSDVIWFDPTSLGSARYNPLDRIRADSVYAIRDTQNVVETLSASIGGGGDKINPSFVEPAKDFATAAIIYWLTHAPMSQRNFSGLRVAFSNCQELATRMLQNEHRHPRVNAELRTSASYILNNPSERFIGSVEGVIRSWLRVYQNTILATVTSRSDFCPEDLVAGPRPVTLYIHLPPSDDEALAPFINLMIGQIIDDLMTWEKMTRSGSPKRWQLAWIIDEAWRLGRIKALEGALADMRSYCMRTLLGVQGLNQIVDHYGLHNSVFNNCRWVTSWQNGFDECKHVADMLGEEERVKTSHSRSINGAMLGSGGATVSTSMEWRPVVQSAHVGRIPKERVIIFGEEKPILAYRSHPYTWQKLIRPLEPKAHVIGTLLPGPLADPDPALLPYLTRLLPGPPSTPRLPPPGGPETPPDSSPPPKRPRRRL
jgi:type IV secretion system protein VirD4